MCDDGSYMQVELPSQAVEVVAISEQGNLRGPRNGDGVFIPNPP